TRSAPTSRRTSRPSRWPVRCRTIRRSAPPVGQRDGASPRTCLALGGDGGGLLVHLAHEIHDLAEVVGLVAERFPGDAGSEGGDARVLVELQSLDDLLAIADDACGEHKVSGDGRPRAVAVAGEPETLDLLRLVGKALA